ncbi:MAG: type II toxin-antitoxin system RelE/ParE family toxin [Thermoanaerobaculia bacterium]|nr:type II toxin-antitoxin system RelE/ParE family toxin [Thermoanaerobaculia bacterium]
MTGRHIARRTLARRDFEEVVDYYLEQASVEVAMQWIAALEDALDHIVAHPRSGSPRLGHELRIARLRSWPVTGFPYLVCYIEGEERIDVLRILHRKRDVRASLG